MRPSRGGGQARGWGKRYQSGYQKRKSWGLKGWAFLYHKYGSDVEKNQRSSLATRTRARS